jgi:hypothetical protein
MTVRQQQAAEQSAESESVGSVRPGSREHLWAEYESAVRDWESALRDWEKAGAAERAHVAAYEFATEIWHRERAEEQATWRRSREAFEAWRDAADAESVERDRAEVR